MRVAETIRCRSAPTVSTTAATCRSLRVSTPPVTVRRGASPSASARGHVAGIEYQHALSSASPLHCSVGENSIQLLVVWLRQADQTSQPSHINRVIGRAHVCILYGLRTERCRSHSREELVVFNFDGLVFSNKDFMEFLARP